MKMIEPRQEKLIRQLCQEVDEWKEAAEYWKEMYEEERDANIHFMNERLEESKRGIGQALMLALSLRDNKDGSLSISKEDRQSLAELYNNQG